MRTKLLFCTLLLGTVGLTACGGDDEEEVSLSTQALPLLTSACGGCHTRNNSPTPPAVANMVYLENKDDVLGFVGTFITAGDSANSGFVKILTQEMAVGAGPTVMPPPPAAKMSDANIDIIKKWIDQGAKDN